MRGWVVLVGVLGLVGCTDCGWEGFQGRDGSVPDSGYDAGQDAGTDSGSSDAGHDSGFDAGTDAGQDAGPSDAGVDAGPCDCASAGPCCDGCHLKDYGTPCAVTRELNVATGCLGTGVAVRKDYTWTQCNSAGQCNVDAGPGYVYFDCTGSCPVGQTCTGSCITSGQDRCVTEVGCNASTPQPYFDLGVCP